MTAKSEIELFILNDLLSGSRATIDPEEPLISSSILDSLGLLRVITFIEEQFGIKVGDGEVGDQNFGTLSRILSFVERKQSENAPPSA